MSQATTKKRQRRRQAMVSKPLQLTGAPITARPQPQETPPQPAPLTEEAQYAADVDHLFAHDCELW